MSDFENNIRDQFNREVQPQFEASQWDAYVSYRDRKKKKRRIIVLFFIGIGLLGASYWFMPSSYSDSSSIQEKIASKQLLPAETIESDTDVIMPVESNTEQHMVDTGFPRIEKESIPKSVPRAESIQALIVPGQASIQQDDRLKDGSPTTIKEGLDDNSDAIVTSIISTSSTVESEKITESISEPRNIRPAFDLARMNASNILWSSHLSGAMEIPRAMFAQVTPVKKSKPNFYGRAYIGLSLPSHVQIAEEQASQLGMFLFYNLSQRWRVGLKVELAAINFVSSSFEDKLGIPSLEAPSMDVEFAQAVVESTSLTPTINAEYLWLQQRRWSSYIGVGYGFSTEIYQELEYEFEGDDNTTDDDDISIIISKEDYYTVPKYMQILGGLEYQLNPRLGLNMTFVLPVQLNDDQIDLLRKLQVNLGVSTSF